MDEEHRAAWKAAIAKRNRGEEVSLDEHYALLREGMFEGELTPAVMEEAVLFLRYWLHGLNIDPISWLGTAIANHWFGLRDWDRQWGRNRADQTLRSYIAAKDYDHWAALNEIAARLHRDGESFPDALTDWAAEVHLRLRDGALKPPAKERGDRGRPPYANEDRNGVFFMADNWLEHFGMNKSADRIHVIARCIGDDESVVAKGLARWRRGNWRRAPWPGAPEAIPK